MARVALKDDEVDRIISCPKRVITEFRWRTKANANWVAAELQVENDLKLTLAIHANANLDDRSKYSFALVLGRSFPIARFDAGASHINRHTDSNKWVSSPHKHRWTEACRDAWAYTPTDIDSSDLESAFRSFCVEMNVNYEGTVEALPGVQGKIEF